MHAYRGRLSFLPVEEFKPAVLPRSRTVPEGGFAPSITNANASINGSGDSSLVPPSLSESVPSNWVTIEDNFYYFIGSSISHIGRDYMHAPESEVDDGLIYLGFLRHKLSRAAMVKLIGDAETGAQTKHPAVDYVAVKAFRLVPLTPSGILTVDGEVVPYGAIQGHVLPGIARVITGASHKASAASSSNL